LYRAKSNVCPFVILPSNYSDFYISLNKKFRKNLEYRERRLGKIGDVEYLPYDKFPSIKHAMNELFALNVKRFHSMGKTALFDDVNMRNFHQEIANTFSKKGWLRLGFLTVDKTPVAADYSFAFKNKVYAYHSGFDPEYRNYGVGRLCELYHIKYLIENGYEEYDWLRGYENYIKDWTKSYYNNLEIRYSKRAILSDIFKFIKEKKEFLNIFMEYLPDKIRERFRYI
jgi:CelD/BcsL family acetyltransferase involved in cellulose biosynthesis